MLEEDVQLDKCYLTRNGWFIGPMKMWANSPKAFYADNVRKAFARNIVWNNLGHAGGFTLQEYNLVECVEVENPNHLWSLGAEPGDRVINKNQLYYVMQGPNPEGVSGYWLCCNPEGYHVAGWTSEKDDCYLIKKNEAPKKPVVTETITRIVPGKYDKLKVCAAYDDAVTLQFKH